MLVVAYACVDQVEVVAFEVYRVVVLAVDACMAMEFLWYCA